MSVNENKKRFVKSHKGRKIECHKLHVGILISLSITLFAFRGQMLPNQTCMFTTFFYYCSE
jgi:hypothetical protein